MSKKSIFSLDGHISADMNVSGNVSFFKSVFAYVFHTPKRPVMSLAEARTAWGIDDFSDIEIEKYSVNRLYSGMLAGILFCFLLFLMFYNFYQDSFGLFSGVGYTAAMLSALCICSICLWQSDMLHSSEFVPYSEYILKYKWLFSLLLFVSVCAMQYEAVTAIADPVVDPVDMPEMKVKNTSDLSSIFIGHIIGGPWTNYVNGDMGNIFDIFGIKDDLISGLSINLEDFKVPLLAGSMSSVLLLILACLNTGALLFVSVFATYIFVFGSVQVAHSGDWKDSQLFSTFWSPVRTSGAIALCSPLTNGISLLHHLILLAIAMSINLANNVSNSFTGYLANNQNLYSLGVPTAATGRNYFSEVFCTLLNGAIIQIVGENIHGDYLRDADGNKIDTRNEDGDLIGTDQEIAKGLIESNNADGRKFVLPSQGSNTITLSKNSTVLTCSPPGSFYLKAMPAILLEDAGSIEDKKDIVTMKLSDTTVMGTYKKAITEMYVAIYRMTDSYLTSKLSGRKTADLTSSLTNIYENFVNKIEASTFLANNLPTISTSTVLENLKAETDKHGWLTIGIYPFIVSKLQDTLQQAVTVKLSYFNEKSLTQYKKTVVGGESEWIDVKAYINAVKKTMDDLYKNGAIYDTNFAPDIFSGSDSVMERMAYKALSYTGLNPYDLMEEFKTHNAVAVLHSKGWLCINMAKSMLGALSGKKDMSSILSDTFGFGSEEREALSANDELEAWRPVLVITCGILLLFGISCIFVLPSLPILFWGRAAVSWAVLVVQTLMGAPFWAATHVLPEGVGLAGQHARRGYMLLLDVFLRPCLLVCGAIMVMLLMEVWTKIFAEIYYIWWEYTNKVADMTIVGIFFTTGVVLFGIYTTVRWLYIQAIGEFPQKVIQWCGGQPADNSTQDVMQNMQAMTGKMQDLVNRMGGGGYNLNK